MNIDPQHCYNVPAFLCGIHWTFILVCRTPCSIPWLRGRLKRRDSAATRHRIFNERRLNKNSFAYPGPQIWTDRGPHWVYNWNILGGKKPASFVLFRSLFSFPLSLTMLCCYCLVDGWNSLPIYFKFCKST
jgi:hypothetical protein